MATIVPDQQEVAAEFHALLDKAADQIHRASEEGRLSPETERMLRAGEARLRYQIRQLRAAAPAAAIDLESGMRLSWSRFESQLRDSTSASPCDAVPSRR